MPVAWYNRLQKRKFYERKSSGVTPFILRNHLSPSITYPNTIFEQRPEDARDALLRVFAFRSILKINIKEIV